MMFIFWANTSRTIIIAPIGLLICMLIAGIRLSAQTYTPKDSIQIYQLLDKADEQDGSGDLTAALNSATEALYLSKAKLMKRGEGFALLKIADLQLKKGSPAVPGFYEVPKRIGIQLKDSFLTGLAHHQLAQLYRDRNRYAEADSALQQALNYYTSKNAAEYIPIVYNDRGFIAERQGNSEKAVRMYLSALRIFEESGNKKEAANTLGNIAITHYKMGNKEEAIRLFKSSAAIRESIGDNKGLAAVYGNLVTAYSAAGLEDSAYTYQLKSLQYAEKTGVKNTLAQAYTNAGMLAGKRKNYQEAISYDNQSARLYNEMGDRGKLASRYISLAIWHHKLNDSSKAEYYFQQAEQLAEALHLKPVLQSLHNNKSAFYSDRMNYQKSIEQYRLFVIYKDSLLNEKNTATIAELNTKYETEKKDLQIAQLETDRKIRQLEIEKQQAIIAGNKEEALRKETAIQLLKQQRELQEAALNRQQEELDKQTLLNKNNEQQLLLSVQQLQIAENEKKLRARQIDRERFIRNSIIVGSLFFILLGLLLFNRFQLRKKIEEQNNLMKIRNNISKDLHDEIGSTLTSIHILSTVSLKEMETNPQHSKTLLQDISQQSKSIQQSMSDIVWAIRPDNEKLENLTTRMREYLGQTLEPLEMQTQFQVNEDTLNQSLPMEHRKELLLIFKEAVNNIAKHANASHAAVSLKIGHGKLQMEINDNGIWKGTAANKGTGTFSMNQRAASLGGTVQILGSEKGTTVKLELPL